MALLVLVPAGAGAAVSLFVAPVVQIAAIGGLALVALSAMLARTGRSLNPAWVLVATLYLIAPAGTALSSYDISGFVVVAVAVALAPFVIATLITDPHARAQLTRLAPLVLLLALALLSLLWSVAPAYGLQKTILWIVTGVLPAAYLIVLATRAPRVAWVLILAAAVISGAALLAFGTASPLYPGRPTLFGTNPIWAARAMFIGALVAMFGPFRLVVRILATPVLIAAGLATVSIGPAIGLILGAEAGFVAVLRRRNLADPRVVLGWSILVLGTLALAIAYVTGNLDGPLATLTNVVGEGNVTVRGTYLGVAVDLFQKAPVLGIGIGGFASTGLDTYPHNLAAEVAVELGSVGCLILLGWLVLAFRGAVRSPLLLALVVATGTFALFSGSLASNAEFWMFSALAVANIQGGRDRVPARARIPAAEQAPIHA